MKYLAFTRCTRYTFNNLRACIKIVHTREAFYVQIRDGTDFFVMCDIMFFMYSESELSVFVLVTRVTRFVGSTRISSVEFETTVKGVKVRRVNFLHVAFILTTSIRLRRVTDYHTRCNERGVLFSLALF